MTGTSINRSSAIGSMAAAALMFFAGYAVFFLAPTERTMGEVQRIFYFHVSSAWTAFAAFFLVFLANIMYLIRRKQRWDHLAVSAAEVGTAFCTVVLITGPIWAKPVWGIWWTWDARLTSTFVLWLLYVGYLLLRTTVDEPGRRALISAVFGIFAFLDVPIVYMSIRWWRTQHPQPVIAGGESSGLDPTMWKVLLISLAALLGLMVHLVRQRYRLEQLHCALEDLRLSAGETQEIHS